VALAEKFDLPIYGWYGRYLGGWAKAQGPTSSQGLALMEEAFPPVVSEPAYKRDCVLLAEARFDAGRVTDALALADHALTTGEGPASGQCVSEVHRLRGVFLEALGSPADEVERALRTALYESGLVSSGISSGERLRLPERHPACGWREAPDESTGSSPDL
jgi:hypothetical protein